MAKVCTGQCLVGKCPFERCIKAEQRETGAREIKAQMRILDHGVLPEQLQSSRTGYGIAVDIGTTTVVAYLVDMSKPAIVAAESKINMQTSLGLDVISRIKLCRDSQTGLQRLNDAIISQLNTMFEALLTRCEIAVEDITCCCIAGNTTMQHLLANLSPASMGVLPFEPLSHFGERIPASKMGLKLGELPVEVCPCVSAFVGGDITSAMLACGFFDAEETCLLLDIGTNGEVALGNRNHVVVTSTAAGPAFEGAHIHCGMGAVAGAVSHVGVENGSIAVQTVGDAKPIGICGSGLLDAVAVFCESGLIDETGRIDDERQSEYLTEHEGKPAIKLCEDVIITQRDIRELQTAKAAIAAGVRTLIHTAGLQADDVKKVYLAGGFGTYMDVASAQRIGLIPAELNNIISVGNAAGSGAVLSITDEEQWQRMNAISARGEHVELGSNPYFMDQYVEGMTF